MAIEIVDFPINHPWLCERLPEGTCLTSINYPLTSYRNKHPLTIHEPCAYYYTFIIHLSPIATHGNPTDKSPVTKVALTIQLSHEKEPEPSHSKASHLIYG